MKLQRYHYEMEDDNGSFILFEDHEAAIASWYEALNKAVATLAERDKRIAELEAEVIELKKSLLKTGKVYNSVEEMQDTRPLPNPPKEEGK